MISALPVSVVKAHSLYIPKNSVLYEEYRMVKYHYAQKKNISTGWQSLWQNLEKILSSRGFSAEYPRKMPYFQTGESAGGN